MANLENPSNQIEQQEVTPERIISPIEGADRLNESGGGPIFVLHGGGAGAAMSAQLVAYLEDSSNPLPKAIVGSSAGSFIANVLRHSVRSIRPSRGTESEDLRYQDEVRTAMIESLTQVFTKKIQDIIGNTNPAEALVGKVIGFFNKDMNLEFFYNDIGIDKPFPKDNSSYLPFDLIVAYTAIENEDDTAGKSTLVANENISLEVGDASSAFYGKNPEDIGKGDLGIDGNYGNYHGELAKSLQPHESIIVFTSYVATQEEREIGENVDNKLEKAAYISNRYMKEGVKALHNIAGDFQIRRAPINESHRSETKEMPNVFRYVLEQERTRIEKKGQ